MSESKRELFERGCAAVTAFCAAHPGIGDVVVIETDEPKRYRTCAYYRSSAIYISVDACSAIGTAGRSWSYPGYVVDRTPFGVLAHELGHHVDRAHGRVPGQLSPHLRDQTKSKPITTYAATNTNEWFAEAFRLFITNPDLLRLIRAELYAPLRERFKPVETRPWDEVIDVERQRAAARNKIAEVERSKRRRKPAPAAPPPDVVPRSELQSWAASMAQGAG